MSSPVAATEYYGPLRLSIRNFGSWREVGIDTGRNWDYSWCMAKGDFIIIRAKGEDKAVLAECAELSRQTLSEVVRVSIRRYLADLKRGQR